MLYSGLLSNFWLGQKSSLFPETLVALCDNIHFICTLEVKELRKMMNMKHWPYTASS